MTKLKRLFTKLFISQPLSEDEEYEIFKADDPGPNHIEHEGVRYDLSYRRTPSEVVVEIKTKYRQKYMTVECHYTVRHFCAMKRNELIQDIIDMLTTGLIQSFEDCKERCDEVLT